MDEAGDPRSDGPPRRARSIAPWLVLAVLAVVIAVWASRPQTSTDGPSEPATQPDSSVPRPPTGPRTRKAAPDEPAARAESDAAATIAEGTTAVSIDVVTEDGSVCREGTVTFKAPNVQLMQRGMAPLKYLRDASLVAANPVVLRDLPDDMDGLDVEATALVPGMASATEKFTVRAHRVTSVRMVVPRGRSAEVRVLESETEVPVAGASVVSLTEAERRRVDTRTLRGTNGSGAAVTDPEGKCVVGGLGSGEHEFVIDARDHRRTKAKWSAGPLIVRLDRVKGTGTVNVTVLDPDGKPAPDIVVEQVNADRKATTGPDGRVRFDDVPAGLAFFRFEFPSGAEFDRWQSKMDAGLALLTEVDVAPGGTHEVELGMRRTAASFDGRLVAEDGSPIAGARITLMADLGIHRGTTDEAGFVRLPDVAASKVLAFVEVDPRTDWIFGDVEVKAGERATATWTLGSATLRGRVVQGAESTAVAQAVVRVSGPLSGRTSTDFQGGFAFTRARPGTYRVEIDAASSPGYAARPVDLTVPSEKETVIELVRCGAIVVRFAAADRSSLRDAKIVLTSAAGAAPDLSRPESGDGDLVAHNVLPGRYEVVVETAGRRRTFPAEVKGGETTVVEVGAP